MQILQKVEFSTVLVYCLVILNLASLGYSSTELLSPNRSHYRNKDSRHQPSAKVISDITLHGVLFWASMGFMMPVGILFIRSAGREENQTRAKVLFYIHVILQVLSALLATAGAVLSLRNLENSFDNGHQRIGVGLYVAIWMQAFIGFFRPKRGCKKRGAWFIVHWILGTIITVVGIFNVYTGLKAFNKKTSRSIRLWTILFTAEVSFIAFFYLLQDKWEYMQKQEEFSGNEPTTPPSSQVITQGSNQKELLPEQCPKRNALKNLFD